MKLIGMLLALLLITGLVITQMKQFGGDDGSTSSKPMTNRFRGRCLEVSGAMDKPGPYCECLWKKGVTNLGRLVSDPQAQEIAAGCKNPQ